MLSGWRTADRQPDPGAALRECARMIPRVKICGVMRAEDAALAPSCRRRHRLHLLARSHASSIVARPLVVAALRPTSAPLASSWISRRTTSRQSPELALSAIRCTALSRSGVPARGTADHQVGVGARVSTRRAWRSCRRRDGAPRRARPYSAWRNGPVIGWGEPRPSRRGAGRSCRRPARGHVRAAVEQCGRTWWMSRPAWSRRQA